MTLLLRSRASARLWTASKIALSLLLLVATLRLLQANIQVDRLAHVDPLWVLSGLLACTLAQVAGCLRFHFTAARMQAPIPARDAFTLSYIALLLNQVLLFGMAGDALRVARHGALLNEGRAGFGRALRVHAVDRLSGQLMVFLLFAFSAPPWLARGSMPLSLAILLGLLGVGAIMLRTRVRHTLLYWFGEARAALFEQGALTVQMGLSSVVTLCCVLTYFCAARAVMVELSFDQVLRIGPLVLAAMSVPIGVGGWGPREAASAALFSANALDPGKGFLVSILYGLISLVAALPALPLWLFSQPEVGGTSRA